MNASQLVKILASLMQGTERLSERDQQSRPGRWLNAMNMDHHRRNESTGAVERNDFKRDKSMSARQFKRKKRMHRQNIKELAAGRKMFGDDYNPRLFGPERQRRVMRHIEVPDYRYFKGRTDDLRARGSQ